MTCATARRIDVRKGDWMQTFTGRKFWPLDPRPEDVDIRDIAHALSLQCRYNGHCERFYSVAEHSVLVANYVEPQYRLAALLHDASEAYCSDVPRPMKPDLTNYAEIEHVVSIAIAQKFGISHQYPWPAQVKEVDNAILHDEKAALMVDGPEWRLPGASLGAKIECWSPFEAEVLFLRAFDRAGGVA